MTKLMVIADLAGQAIATPRGLQIADKLGLDAEVVAFVYVPLKQLKVDASTQEQIKQRLLEERQEEVQARIDSSVSPEQKVTLKVVWEKDVAGWTSKQCSRQHYEMIVKTGQRSESIAHTSTDWQLLRECPAPVLVVAEKKWARTKPVLASVDLSSEVPLKKKLNSAILERAKTLAEAMDTSLEIICAVEVPPLLADLDLIDTRAYVKNAKEEIAPHVSALAKQLDIPEKAFHIKKGPVERVIASQAANTRAQIVVLGTVGRKGVKARLLGNTAERVLRHLKTDILALKP